MRVITRVEIGQGSDDRWFWRAFNAKGEELNASQYGYDERYLAVDVAKALFKNAAIFVDGDDLESETV